MTRALLLTALFVTACSQAAPTEAPVAEPVDSFLESVKTDYPVGLTPLGEGIWVHRTVYALPGQGPITTNGLAVINGESVTLVDGAWGELATISLIEHVREQTELPIETMIVTSHMPDRTMGVDAAEREGLKVFTHPTTPQLAAMAGWPAPNTSVAAVSEPRTRARVGQIEIAYPGHGHTSDNLVAYLPGPNILYTGSLVRGTGATNLGIIDRADLSSWRDALIWLKETYPDTRLLVPSRGPGADLASLDATIAMIDAELDKSSED